eukprot:TRINITY_DN4568_c0_g2_i7.p1 TRINITY_DN4568_c0_g2~~TRINITY_DN4568_c0_g2_i7.p1  ORF type:complete len:403 (+),score=141.26 TRINITY_DN4568_c0_g2_i7:67-1275(+)
MPFITPEGLEHLKTYKYASGLSGWLDQNVMTPFWNWFVTLLPDWLAPNLITLLSLLHAVIAYSVLHYYCPTMSEPAPCWTYLLYVYCGFMYQTLDAVDGKQARRTGSSSPLGQLFDHGCDAVSAFLTGMTCATTLQLGSSWLSLMVLYMCIIPFFCANWEESQTHVMRFGFLGVTEGQFLIMAVHLVTGIFGPKLWLANVPVLDIPIRQFFVAIALISVFWALYESISTVSAYFAQKEREAPTLVGVCVVRQEKRAAVAQLGQYLTFIVLSTLWLMARDQFMLHNQARLAMATVGFIFAYLTSRLIISHVTNMPYEKFHTILYPLPALVVLSYLPTPNALLEVASYAYFVMVVVVYFHYVSTVINEITSHLGISCFTIPYPLPATAPIMIERAQLKAASKTK